MYKNKLILATICARAGSTGIKNKNIRLLGGNPVISYSLDLIQNSNIVDDYIISTNGDDIIQIVKDLGYRIDFKRPDYLGENSIARVDVVKHSVEWYEEKHQVKVDVVVDLGVATPFKSIEDMENAIKMLVDNDYDNIITATNSHRNPYFNMVELNNNTVKKVKDAGRFTNRQETPIVYDMNDAFNVYKRDILENKEPQFNDKTGLYIMPKERSIDLDEPIDFLFAEALINTGIVKS